MAGFYAVADPAEPVRTDLDNELEGEPVSVEDEIHLVDLPSL